MKAIVAADRNWGIGYQNRLLVSIPSDMKFFSTDYHRTRCSYGPKDTGKFPKWTST